MQKQIVTKSLKEMLGMSIEDLESYKVNLSLAAKRASTVLESEQYLHAKDRVNMVINNKQLGGH